MDHADSWNGWSPIYKYSAYSSARPSSDDLDIFYPSETRPESKPVEIYSSELRCDDSSDDEYSDGETLREMTDTMASTPSFGPRLVRKVVKDRIHTPQSLEGSEDLKLKESQREEFLGTVFGEHGAFTSHSPTTSTGSEGGSNSSQPAQTPSSSTASRSSYLGDGGASQKRKQAADDEEEQRDPERPRKHGRPSPPQHPDRKSDRGRRLACHFHLIDKEFYCKNHLTGKRFETCSGPGWYTMHHLK